MGKRLIAFINSKWFLFAITALVFYLATVFLGQRPFLWDVAGYWGRGQQLFEQGHLSFSIDSFRGYIFPLYLGICGQIFHGGIQGWEIINSIQLAAFFTWIFPKLFRDSINLRVVRGMAAIVFFLLFCYGVVVNPSSDIIAFECCCIAQILVSKIGDDNTKWVWIEAFIVGICIYEAYNTRTIYLFAGIILLIEIAVLTFKKKGWRKSFFFVPLGMLLSSIPQALINYRQNGLVSLKVQTNGLFSQQLLWGLQYQRYDSTISDAIGSASVYYIDRVGLSIMGAEGIVDSISYAQYAGLFLKYPFEMIGLLFRHFVNMMFPIFPENFIADLDKNKIIFAIAFILISVIFGVLLFAGCIQKTVFLNYIPMLVPILCIIPGAVEQRFGLGLYLFVIGCVCYSFDWEKFRFFVKGNTMKVVLVAALIIGLFICIWTSMLVSIEVENVADIRIDYPLFIE